MCTLAIIIIRLLLPARRQRTKTVKVRTALSCPCPAGQTDSGQFFSKIRTADRIETGEIRTKTRQGQNTTIAVRRCLLPAWFVLVRISHFENGSDWLNTLNSVF